MIAASSASWSFIVSRSLVERFRTITVAVPVANRDIRGESDTALPRIVTVGFSPLTRLARLPVGRLHSAPSPARGEGGEKGRLLRMIRPLRRGYSSPSPRWGEGAER